MDLVVPPNIYYKPHVAKQRPIDWPSLPYIGQHFKHDEDSAWPAGKDWLQWPPITLHWDADKNGKTVKNVGSHDEWATKMDLSLLVACIVHCVEKVTEWIPFPFLHNASKSASDMLLSTNTAVRLKYEYVGRSVVATGVGFWIGAMIMAMVLLCRVVLGLLYSTASAGCTSAADNSDAFDTRGTSGAAILEVGDDASWKAPLLPITLVHNHDCSNDEALARALNGYGGVSTHGGGDDGDHTHEAGYSIDDVYHYFGLSPTTASPVVSTLV
jgi:hypothetical protein